MANHSGNVGDVLDTEKDVVNESKIASADVNANEYEEKRTGEETAERSLNPDKTATKNVHATPDDLAGSRQQTDACENSSGGEEEFHSPCASPEQEIFSKATEQEDSDSEHSDSDSSSYTSSSEGEYDVKYAEAFGGCGPKPEESAEECEQGTAVHVDTVQGMLGISKNEPMDLHSDTENEQNRDAALLHGLPFAGISDKEDHQTVQSKANEHRTFSTGLDGERECKKSASSVTGEDILQHFPGPGCVLVTDDVSNDDVFEEGRPAIETRQIGSRERRKSYKVIKNRSGSLEIIQVDPIDVTTEADIKEALIQRNVSIKGSEHRLADGNNMSQSSQGKLNQKEAATSADLPSTATDSLDGEHFNGRLTGCPASDSINSQDHSHNLQQTTELQDQGKVIKTESERTDKQKANISQDLLKQTEWCYTSENVAGSQNQVELTGLNSKSELSEENVSQVENIPEKEETLPKIEDAAKTKRKNFMSDRAAISFDQSSSLPLSPEETSVSLTKFLPADDVDTGSPEDPPDNSEKERIQDGKEHEFSAVPSAPPRRRKPKLRYSATFSAAEKKTLAVAQKVKERSNHRSSRWMTLPGGLGKSINHQSLEFYQHEHVTLITDQLPLTFSNFPSYKRAQVALELYTTERTFVRGVETIIELFKNPLEEFLDSKELNTLFSNIQQIFLINKSILFNMLEKINHWTETQCIGQIFIQAAPQLKIYATFCNNYDDAEKLIKLKTKRKDFETFLKNCYLNPICQPGITLPVYLISVVHRIPRYILLLKELLKRTPEKHPDYRDVEKALKEMDKVARYINNRLQAVQGQKAMAELRSRVIGLQAYEVPGRALFKTGEVTLSGNTRVNKCLLFNDLLVFAYKGVLNQEVELTLELETVWFTDLQDDDPHSIKEDSLEVFTPERSHIIYAGSKSEKKLWLQKLESAVSIKFYGEEATGVKEIDVRKASFTYKDGRIYCGEFRSGKRHGQGVLAWPNQTRYVGQWEDDDRNGEGELTFSTGEKYKGQWADDKQHGHGILYYNNGDEYHGDWAEGKMHGQGEIRFANKDHFKGQFVRGEIQGHGELKCVSGLLYSGQWVASKKHGKGTLKSGDGNIYSGDFVNDRINGQGEMRYTSGATYVGHWNNGERQGTGVYSCPDCTRYEGDWSEDCMTGKGIMIYANGDKYTGCFFKNMRYGKGITTYQDGARYEGQYEYDHRHGTGNMWYKDGTHYSGGWEIDQRHSKGKMVYADKSCYEGDWMYGLRHGEGKMIYANEATYQGHWEFGKENGAGSFTDPNAKYTFKGNWHRGKKNGHGIEVSNLGTFEGEWKDGMRSGPGKEELRRGPSFEGKWKENRKHGPGKRKLRTGMEEEQVWDSGQLVGPTGIVAIELPPIQRQ